MESKKEISSFVVSFIKKYDKWMAFLLAWLIVFMDLLVCDIRTNYYDAGAYNEMSEYFIGQGLFHFWIEPGSECADFFAMRGYAWPFLIAVCKILGCNSQIGFWIVYSALLAGGLAFALPQFIEELFQKKIPVIARILPMILTICFWNGLVKFLLSDLPAVITVTWGLLFLTKITEKKRFYQNFIAALLSGALLWFSYYIRSGCKPIILLAVLVILLYKLKKQRWKKFFLILAMCIGVVITAVPQIIINISFNDEASYEVPIFLNSNIVSNEYYGGFQVLRYETNASGIHPEEVMASFDPVIEYIMAAEDIVKEDATLLTVLKLMAKYPLEFLGLYMAKLANFIDPRYGNVIYIKDLNIRQYHIRILNYLLWFFSALGIGIQWGSGAQEGEEAMQWKNAKQFMKKYFLYVFAFLVPALIHLAGTHVEARYFYPGYVFMYTYFSMLCPWKEIGLFLKKRCFTVLVVGLALFGCLNAVWNFTFENFHYAQLFIQDDFQQKNISKYEFLKSCSDKLGAGCEIESFAMKDSTYLSMSGYITKPDKKDGNISMALVLLSNRRQYVQDINLAYPEYKFSINKELIGLHAGSYRVGILLKEGENAKLLQTVYTVEIVK